MQKRTFSAKWKLRGEELSLIEAARTLPTPIVKVWITLPDNKIEVAREEMTAKAKAKRLISLSQSEILGFGDEFVNVNVTKLKKYIYYLIGELLDEEWKNLEDYQEWIVGDVKGWLCCVKTSTAISSAQYIKLAVPID